MTESIGTARLDIVVDTSSFDAAITSAKNRVSGMSQAAQAEYAKLNSAEKRRVDSLITQADTLGKTRQEQILYNAALRGTPTAVLDDLKRKLAGVNQQTLQNVTSTKQLNAAMRGVPAQLTDIFTSLQGGQSPLTVLFQQGGQLRDMFGGIKPAAAALGSSLAGLINPATVAAGAFALLAVAWKQGSDEAVGFNQALALTGNFAGTTADQMAGMAIAISSATTTQHEAAAALADVARTGKFTADQLDDIASAAVAMEHATGQAIDQTVAQFAKLADDPVKAITELNQTYHFLTEATYAQIKALQDQGRVEEATRLAIQISSSQLKQRADEVVDNAGYMERAWHSLGAVVRQVWDDIRNAGRATTAVTQAQMQIASANSQLNSLAGTIKTFVGNGGIYTKEREARDRAEIARLLKVKGDAARAIANDPAQAKATRDAAQQRANELAIALDQEASSYATAEQKRAQRIAAAHGKANDAAAAAMKAGNNALVAKIRADESAIVKAIAAEGEKKAPGGSGGRTRRAGSGGGSSAVDPTSSIVSRIQQQIALNTAEAASEDRLTASARLRLQVQQQLSELGAKAAPARRALIETLLAELDASDKLAEKNKDEAKAKQELARLTNQLAVAEENRRRQNDADIAQIGLGAQEVERLRRKLDIEREYEDGLKEIRRNSQGKTADALKAEESALKEMRARELAGEEEFWRRMSAAQGNWLNGANKAFSDYITEAGDVAGQTETIFRNAFNGLEDVLTDFFTKGKADWRGFLDSVAADITRFIIRQQLSKWLQSIQSGMGGEGGGGWASLIGSIFKSGGGTNANGNAFLQGNVVAFARGGVIGSPMHFPMSGGRVGLMGEAGPEAIVPLKRGPDGKLGVRMEREPDGRQSSNVNQTFVIQGRLDHRTEQQLARTQAREAQRAVARNA